MKELKVPETKEELEKLERIYLDAQSLATSTEDIETQKRADAIADKCEKFFDECKFHFDDSDQFCEK